MALFPRCAASLASALCLATVAPAFELPRTSQDTAGLANFLAGQGRYEEAHDVTSAWLRLHPDDPTILFRQAYNESVAATIQSDPARATEMRKAAFADATRARQLGANDALLPTLLAGTDASGHDLTDPRRFSAVPAAAAEMAKGETAFARRDMGAALQCYQRAFALDPHAYSAALYTGDVYFNQRKYADAIAWFGKAIAIDPDRETAHRYLGDTYAKQEHRAEATAAYIDAVIAEPYNRTPREMLARSAPQHRLATPEVRVPVLHVFLGKDGPHIDITPNASPLLLAYALGRANWLVGERTKFFPKNAPPRHSVYEECAGLRLLVGTANEIKSKETGLEPLRASVAVLEQLVKAGLLEAYMLLDRADKEIAADYAAYRRQHRDKLVRYINEVWLRPPAAPPKPTAPSSDAAR